MPSAFDVLASDHEQVEQLLATFERAPAASGTNDSLLAARKKTAETLVIEASKHEAIEEMYFWPAVRKLLPDGDNLADQAISQEQEGKEVLARLDKLDAEQPRVRQAGR
jgi:Hemerythrin HHE cation binding domain